MPQPRQRRRDDTRLRRDIADAVTEFPTLELVEDAAGDITLQGTIPVTIGSKHGIVRTATVTVRFPIDYPRYEPEGWIKPGTFNAHPDKTLSDRHIAADGKCCLELPALSTWDASDPEALRKWLRNFALFVHRQFLYDLNGGQWPGPEWKHGSLGWAQYAVERVGKAMVPTLVSVFKGTSPPRKAACPCGSGIAWANCHKRVVADVISALPFDDRTEIIELLGNSDVQDVA